MDEVRVPLPEEREEAKRWPNGFVYRIDGTFSPEDRVPPEAIVGAWRVDEYGNIVGEFEPNPNYKYGVPHSSGN